MAPAWSCVGGWTLGRISHDFQDFWSFVRYQPHLRESFSFLEEREVTFEPWRIRRSPISSFSQVVELLSTRAGNRSWRTMKILVLCVLVGVERLDWEVGMLNHISGSSFYTIFYFISISKPCSSFTWDPRFYFLLASLIRARLPWLKPMFPYWFWTQLLNEICFSMS